MPNVLNGPVVAGDLVAYSVRRHWDMATRIGVVVKTAVIGIKVRVVKSSDGRELTRSVWLYDLNRVVRVKGVGQ